MSLLPSQAKLGFCSWSVRPKNVEELIAAAKEIGLQRVQLALDPLLENPAGWTDCFKKLKDAGIEVPTAMTGCVGEDYTTIESIHRTGGVVPDATWPQSLANMKAAAPVASAAGVQTVMLHAGFIPDDKNDATYAKVLDRIRQVATVFAEKRISVCLETGQESATTLLGFLKEVDRSNVHINFDPANMLLYGSGDPIAALKLLVPYVLSVHIKDAKRSPSPGVWGEEVPVGTGEVDWNAFFEIFQKANFAGTMMIEREAGEQRIADIRTGREFVMK